MKRDGTMAAPEKSQKPVKKMAKPEPVEKTKKAKKTEVAAGSSIHPQYEEIIVTCSCGHTFKTFSTLGRKDLHLEICSECHPFFTGQQKLVDTSGRVEKFNKKYARKAKAKS